MIIIAKDGESFVNTEYIANIFCGRDGATVKVDFQNGRGCQIARYNTEQQAKTALRMIIEAMRTTEVFQMPDNKTVDAKIQQAGTEQYHNRNGKKTKGHGAS